MPKHSDNEQSVIPGMEGFMEKKEEEFFFSGQKRESYFDSTSLPDAPGRQENAHGHTTYVMYVLFPTQEDLVKALGILTAGYRKGLKAGDKIGSLNAVARMPNDPKGRTFLEYWAEEFSQNGKKKKKDEVNDDEAHAPI